ncbi:Prostaglandin F synthase 1 [Tupaia chinensis]|uniref:Prostaglandin F synthase 1 n=1 Tax=Tupaia chinensis TaxID=246437 RepID=L9LAG4_TUPCH|nr:Prostaglandin F synthase 1 [Tupaia chinensis]
MMDLNQSHSVKLNDGHFMPVLGFGTYAPEEIPKSKAFESTKVAIDVGYRHIDAAHLYQNEEEVGKAIREKIADGTVKRKDIFYTTKLWATFHRPELVQPALERSLKKLQLDYVDLFLIHVPVAMKVECHPYLNQSKLLEFCKSKDIVLVAYSALGSHRDPKWVDVNSPHLLEDPILKTIAKKHKRSPGQVALRYLLQRGVVVLAKSFSEKRIKENFQAFDFELTPEDMKEIQSLNRNLRYGQILFMTHLNEFQAVHLQEICIIVDGNDQAIEAETKRNCMPPEQEHQEGKNFTMNPDPREVKSYCYLNREELKELLDRGAQGQEKVTPWLGDIAERLFKWWDHLQDVSPFVEPDKIYNSEKMWENNVPNGASQAYG